MHSATEPTRRVLNAKMPSRSFSASTAASLRTTQRREWWEQFPNLHIKCVGNLDEVERGDIAFSAFNPAVVGAVNVGETSELLLRKLCLFTQAANLPAEQYKLAVFHRARSLQAHGLSLRTYDPATQRSIKAVDRLTIACLKRPEEASLGAAGGDDLADRGGRVELDPGALGEVADPVALAVEASR